jgi:hypothetical protein
MCGRGRRQTVTRFTSNLGFKTQRCNQKGIRLDQQDPRTEAKDCELMDEGEARRELIVSTTCSSSTTLVCVNPCGTDQLVNVLAAIH